jgi:DNA-binding CsgD family transcriptional regulator
MIKKNTTSKEQMRDMLLTGLTYREIGEKCGISRQRVEQLLSPPWKLAAFIRSRAAGKCEVCGVILRHGHLHHINNDNLTPDQFNDLVNIKYLCLSCHRREHQNIKKAGDQLPAGRPT